MTYTYNMPNMTGGADSVLVGIQAEVPVFVPFLLLFVFLFVLLTGTVSQKRRTGYADMPLWATMSSMATLMITLAMTLAQGLVNGLILGIVISITILSFIWLALGQTNREV
jgi:hypothetical protein